MHGREALRTTGERTSSLGPTRDSLEQLLAELGNHKRRSEGADGEETEKKTR